MRFMMFVKGNADYEAGRPPRGAEIAAIGQLAAEMSAAGVLLDMGGLLPSAAGAKVHVTKGELMVTDGPFTETKELVGGYAILRAASRAEAIELGKRFMQVQLDALGPSFHGELEIRQLADGPGGPR